MSRLQKRIIILAQVVFVALLTCSSRAVAEDSESLLAKLNLKAGALFDFRVGRTDEARSWLDGSLGKARYLVRTLLDDMRREL